MKVFKFLALLVLIVVLIVIALQNTTPVQARVLWLSAEVSVALLLLLTTAGGFVAGLLVGMLARSGTRASPRAQQRRE